MTLRNDFEQPGSPLSLRAILVLIGVLAMFYWLGTWQVSLFDRDEPRFAQPAKEMLFAVDWKDWVVPHLNGEAHFHKPPLPYWQMAGAFKLFGVNDFAARFFSGLWTAVAAGLVAGYLSKRFSQLAGLAGGLAFGTSMMTIVEAKLCTADATLVLLTLIAVFSLWDIYRGAGTPGNRLVLWLSVGVAILVKGPVIFVVLSGLTATLLVLDKNRRWFWRTGFLWGLPLSLAVGLPWYFVADHLSGGALMERFVGYDLIQRFKKPAEGHRGFPGFYVLTGLIDAWPWSAFLAPAAVYGWRHRGERDVKFMFAWLLGPTLILELMATKMVHYWLVILPAYCILLARAVEAWSAGTETAIWERWARPVTVVICLVWAGLAGGAVWAMVRYLGFQPAGVILSAAMLLSAWLIVWAYRQRNPVGHFWTVSLTTVFIAATLSVFVLPQFESYKVSYQLARTMKEVGGENSTYALIRWKEESTIYYLHPGNRDVQIGSAGEFLKFYSQPDTVIAVEDRAFADVQKSLPVDIREGLVFWVVKGCDYTRGFKEKTLYVTRSRR
jgi:4-amino-4-deoxy-L-arabinose transferase-like glycosyltransferase